MSNIKAVTLILENCDFITIPLKDVTYFQVYGANTSLDCHFRECTEIEGFMLVLPKKSEYDINVNDVTHITLSPDYGVTNRYKVLWSRKDEYNSSLQKYNEQDYKVLYQPVGMHYKLFDDVRHYVTSNSIESYFNIQPQ